MAKKKKSAEYLQSGRFIRILAVIGLLTVVLIGYLTYIELQGKHAYLTHDYNRRWDNTILKGKIVTAEGEPLVWSEWKTKDAQEVKYHERIAYYEQLIKASSGGVEADCISALKGSNEYFTSGTDKTGETIHLTISDRLQTKAAEVFNRNMPAFSGAVVAIQPKTGEILCAYAHPKHGEELHRNIAFDAGYAPGSTMKVLWAGVSLEENKEQVDFDTRVSYAGIENSVEPPDTVGLKDALKYSVNTYFAVLADRKLGNEMMQAYAKKVYIGKPLNLYGHVNTIRAKYGNEPARMGIGQGGLELSPLHMAMICATIANDGVLMQPYLVAKTVRYNGRIAYAHEVQVAEKVFSPKTANRVEEGMVAVVNESGGTGSRARIPGITVAGKTGTAEKGTGKNDAWFIGYAPAENPKIAIAVLVEDAGGGGYNAAPIAREVMQYWLELEEQK